MSVGLWMCLCHWQELGIAGNADFWSKSVLLKFQNYETPFRVDFNNSLSFDFLFCFFLGKKMVPQDNLFYLGKPVYSA